MSIRLRLLLLAAVLLAIGCSPEGKRRVTKTVKRSAAATVEDDFDRGRETLFKLIEYDSEEGALRCSLFFNQWLLTQPPGDWKQPAMVDDIPGELGEFSLIKGLDKQELSTNDIEYMESMVWMRDVVGWVNDSQGEPELAAWVAEQKSLEPADRARLTLAAKLFDWTVRNLQLEGFRLTPDNQLYMPGALRTPRMAVLLGIADPWERARVFIQLCRQAEIDAVMLGLGGEQPGAEPTPWLPAVLLGGELYLFDSKLGLPIPVEDDQGIATLSQARERPEVLESLSLGSTIPYPVKSERLDNLEALIDAAPEALSWRMSMLEGRLTGEHRLTLTVDTKALKQRLRPLNLPVRLWTVPIAAARYKLLLERLARNDPAAAAQIRRGEALFVGTTPLIMGRKSHLHGNFTKSADSPGAKLQYMAGRLPDQHIDQLPYNKQLQQSLGLEQGNYKRDDDWMAEMQGLQMTFTEAKRHGSYWIGLVHYEEGNYESAKQWFAKRVLQEHPDSPWVNGARYNLARTFERLGDIKAAREMYLEDNNSPQRHGNLLCARRLKAVEAGDGE